MARSTRIFTAVAGVAFLIGFAITALGQPVDRFDGALRQKFFAGFGGDAAALAGAMRTSEEILAASPNHAEALVWHGSGLLMRSGEAFGRGDLENTQKLMDQAVSEMDRAVELEPDNIGVRVPRGSLYVTASRFMPEEIGRPLLDRGLSDYEHVLKLHGAHFDTIGEHRKGELLFGLAEGWNRTGQADKAAAYFSRIVKEMPDTPYAKRAEKWLKTKSLDRSETGCIGCHAAK